jgi:hypothetical protein
LFDGDGEIAPRGEQDWLGEARAEAQKGYEEFLIRVNSCRSAADNFSPEIA